MGIQLVGVGLGRTGTLSLKLALERLLGGTCHHMLEVFAHPEEIPQWHAAVRGEPVDFAELLDPYVAIVDYPGAAVWRELVAAFPEAPVLLSTRASADEWWDSASATILQMADAMPDDDTARAHTAMANDMFLRSLGTTDRRDRDTIVAAYEAHNAAVRAEVAADRLFEYRPGDGWGPLCAALGVAAPDEEFPHTNTRREFREAAGLDTADGGDTPTPAADAPGATDPPAGVTRAQQWATAAHLAIEAEGPAGLVPLLSDDFVQESHRGLSTTARGEALLGTVRVMRDMDTHVAGTHVAVAGDLHLLTRRAYRHGDDVVELLAVSAWNEDGKLCRLVEFDADALDHALAVLAELGGTDVVLLDG